MSQEENTTDAGPNYALSQFIRIVRDEVVIARADSDVMDTYDSQETVLPVDEHLEVTYDFTEDIHSESRAAFTARNLMIDVLEEETLSITEKLQNLLLHPFDDVRNRAKLRLVQDFNRALDRML